MVAVSESNGWRIHIPILGLAMRDQSVNHHALGDKLC